MRVSYLKYNRCIYAQFIAMRKLRQREAQSDDLTDGRNLGNSGGKTAPLLALLEKLLFL
jgi:hypothetical protein